MFRRFTPLAFALLIAPPPALAAPLDDMGGAMIAELDGQIVAFPLLKVDIDADVQGDLAAVAVTQRFLNPGAVPLNARYQFPLPENAAVYGMAMEIGEDRIVAVIKEKEDALATFETAKAEGKNAALLVQHRPNVFTQDVANLMPGQEIKVTLRYVQTVPKIDGGYELVMPLVVGPRYEGPQTPNAVLPAAFGDDAGATSGGESPDAARDDRDSSGFWSFGPLPAYPPVNGLTLPDAIDEDRVAIDVRLKAGMKIAAADSPTHAIARADVAEDEAIFALASGHAIDNSDFVFRYRLAGEATQAGFLSHQDERGGFFSLLIEPPAIPAEDEIAPREMVFLLDCSGSMDGLPMDASKAFMEQALRRLRPSDSFRIIRFSDSATAFSTRPLPATPENIRDGLRYVDNLRGEGGTNMSSGIHQALAGDAPAGSTRIVVFLTDGYIGAETAVLNLIAQDLGDSRIYAFGVGTGVNRFLLSEIARVGRGFVRYMDPTENLDEVAQELADKLQSPVLTDVSVDWGAFKPTDLSLDRIPDLFAGQSIRVQGRFDPPLFADAAPKRITVRGKVAGREAALPVELDFAETAGGEALPLIWARASVDKAMHELTTPFHLRASGISDDELQRRVTQLGLTYSLATPWTSFVAVSDKVVNAAPQDAADRDVPLPMVAGVSPNAYPNAGGSMPLFAGNSTPEPEAVAGLAVISLLGWLGYRRKRRRAA